MINEEELNSIDLSNDEAPTPDLDGQGSENPSNEEITADKECADKKSCFLLNPKFLLGSNIVLFVAVVILFVLHLKCENPACYGGAVVSNGDSVKTEQFKVAYVQVDSLLANYQFAKQANESLLKKTESSRAQLQRRMQEWQRDAAEFQNKLQNNAFLSRDRAEAENNRLLKKRQELEQLDERLTKELLQEQQKLNEQLKDTVNIFLAEYNKAHKYKIILANTVNDNVLFAEKECDITKEVVDQLNARFGKK